MKSKIMNLDCGRTNPADQARRACQHCGYYLAAWLPLGIVCVLMGGSGAGLFALLGAAGILLAARGIWLGVKATGIHVVERVLLILLDAFTLACAGYDLLLAFPR